jgi:hypothetical protein
MAICKDPSLTYLNQLGFNVVRLPRQGIDPLDVLGRDGKSVERLGRLDQIWSSTVPVPAVKPPQTAVQINGQKTHSLKLSVGLKILANVLGAMGAAVPEVGFAYQKASSVQFTFTSVQVHCVDPFALGRYLSAGDLDTKNPFVARYFQDDDASTFVITDVLKSNSLTVVGLDNRGTTVTVDVPAIQEVVGANVSVAASGALSTELTYQGKEMLSFGFKVFGITYNEGAWQVQGVKPSGEIAFFAPGQEPTPVLLTHEGLLLVK